MLPACAGIAHCLVVKVRPIRNKKKLASGGRFCSTVALSIASAARKRGWKGTGGAGGAVFIAEATAEILRVGGSEKLSGIAVAPNGFINFEADTCPPLTSVSILYGICCGSEGVVSWHEVCAGKHAYKIKNKESCRYEHVLLCTRTTN